MRFLALFLLSNLLFIFSAQAEESPSLFSKFKNLILDAPLDKAHINPVRPSTGQDVNPCLEVTPHDHIPMMERIAVKARNDANRAHNSQEALYFQPYFSGLKGPKITIMRKDLEHALVSNQGSAAEIYHNATLTNPTRSACNKKIRAPWDTELRHNLDLWDSDKTPLYRSDIIVNQRLHFGGYFLGTLGLTTPISDNLDKDSDLRTLTSPRPIRQDVVGYAWQGLNLDRLMISGFATPLPNLYIAGHGGYLEEMFFGGGGEVLYRPSNTAFSIGGEFWTTQKRVPYITGSVFAIDRGNSQTSALLNAWYDVPSRPVTLGVSYGRFLDGDIGGQVQARYKPAAGWEVKGFATLTNQDDRTLDGDTTNLFAGMKLTMPLGQFKGLPDNSRQTLTIAPFARDKGQRINNAYPLYDLTSAWQADKIYTDWHKITE